MALNIVKAKGLAKKAGIKTLIYADSGIGKTNLFHSTGKTLLLSLEKGDLVLDDADNVDIVRATTLAEVREVYQYIKENNDKYDTFGIDSITDLGEQIVAELKAMPEFQDMKKSMPMWMKFSEIMLSIAKSFRNLENINVVITALAESVTNGFEEKILPMIPAKKIQVKLASLYDEVFYIKVNEDGERVFITQPTQDIVAKDRSGKLEQVEPYDKNKGLKPLFDKILGKGE